MRVLVNAVAARRGGGAHHLSPFMRDLTTELPEAKFDLFITPDAPPQPDHERVRIHLVNISAGISLRRLWWDNVTIARRSRRYDLVISPLNFGPIWSKAPHVLFQRNALYFDPAYTRTQPLSSRLRFAAFRWLAIAQSNTADRVVVPTEAMAEFIRPRMRRPDKLIVAPHSIDVEACRSKADLPVVPQARGWADRPIRLLHIGTPSAHKGLDTLADTFITLEQSLPDADIGLAVTCSVDDPGEVVGQFRSRLEGAGLLERVTWLGRVDHDEVFALYRSANVLLLPSRVESFGYPVLEALAVGCPVVASDLPAIREVADGRAGLHEPNSSEEAAHLVKDVLAIGGGAAYTQGGSPATLNGPSQAKFVADLIRSEDFRRVPRVSSSISHDDDVASSRIGFFR